MTSENVKVGGLEVVMVDSDDGLVLDFTHSPASLYIVSSKSGPTPKRASSSGAPKRKPEKATGSTTLDALKSINRKVLSLLPKCVKTKISNIKGKNKVADICGGARIGKHTRFPIPYSDVIKNELTLDNLMTIKNGSGRCFGK